MIVWLHVEEEVHDVAVLNNIFLSFDSELSCGSAGCFRLERNEVLVFDYFGADEALFKVCVDYSRCLRCLVSFVDCPRAALVCSGSKVGAEIQKLICTLDESYHA